MKRALCAAMTPFLILSLAAISVAAGQQKQTPPVALVTGSSRGIGLAVAEEFAQRGWKVIATCRDPDNAVELKRFAATHPTVVVAMKATTQIHFIKAMINLFACRRSQFLPQQFTACPMSNRSSHRQTTVSRPRLVPAIAACQERPGQARAFPGAGADPVRHSSPGEILPGSDW